MSKYWLAACLVFLALLAGVSGLGLALRGNVIAQNNNAQTQALVRDVQRLLTDGRTAAAKSAKKTANEVATLLYIQRYVSNQLKAQANEPAFVSGIIRGIERHIDTTVGRDVHAQANRILRKFGR